MGHFSIINKWNRRGTNLLYSLYNIGYIKHFRYYELRERDVIKFGFSTREYVLLHEKSDTKEVHEETSEDETDESDEN